MEDNKIDNVNREISYNKRKTEKRSYIEKLTFAIVIAVLFITAFNSFQIIELRAGGKLSAFTGNAAFTVQTNTINSPLKSTVQGGIPDVIPKGYPKIYGKEIGVSFDDVSSDNPQLADSTIRKIGTLDGKISLSGKDLERYISIAERISCEYCCGVESIIFSDGKPACGCEHSYAMRGLAKYLIKNHPDEFTDDEILEELGKWKTLFFPSQITQKASVLKAKGIELNYINLASNKYRDIEKDASSANAGAKADMTGWSEDEKMMYEHHGTLPKRLQQNIQQQSQPTMVGGC